MNARITRASATLLTLVGLSLFPAGGLGAQAGEAEEGVRQRFVGNWELISYVSFGEDGQARDNEYVGRILYDAFGNMSAIGMPRDLPSRPRVAGEPPPRAGFAYFSTFSVDPENQRVIHHAVGSPMNPNWVGTDLIRYYAFTDDTLALSIRNAEGRVTGTLTWRKLQE